MALGWCRSLAYGSIVAAAAATGCPAGEKASDEAGATDSEVSATGDPSSSMATGDPAGTLSGVDSTATGSADGTGASSDTQMGGTPLTIDLGDRPCVLHGTDTIDQFVIGGDGSPLSCSFAAGSNAGQLPMGVVLDPSCTTSGEVTEDRGGVWAFMVTVEQSGVEQYVPFCATKAVDPAMYSIAVEVDGADATLQPGLGTFVPGDPIAFGGDAVSDPKFIITDPTVCGTACLFGFSFGLTSSRFDANYFSLPDRVLVHDGADAIGFSHGLSIEGPAVSPDFEARPWVQAVDLDYCLSSDTDACQSPAAIDANGNGRFHYSIIMRPG